MGTARILVVDDEAAIRFGVREFFATHGIAVEEAESCAAAEAALRAAPCDAVLCDYRLPDGDALALLPRLRAIDAEIPVVILTAYGTIDLAVRAIKDGADQFLTKPVELPTLLVVVQRLIDRARAQRREVAVTRRGTRATANPFIGDSDLVRALEDEAGKVAATEAPVMIQGETGSGKGVLARWLHEHGARGAEAFVDLNCAGLSRELLESELFGHEKGAFTGATASKPGLLEIAHRGSLFLDEIGEMDLLVQAKLLKVVEDQRFRRVGSVGDRRVDVRLISATHHDLGRQVQEGRFRADLFYRLSAIPLRVPPLRERPQDIAPLAHHLLAAIAADLGRAGARLSPRAEAALGAYAWPGNIRELRNVLERAVLLGGDGPIQPESLHFQSLAGPPAADDASQLSLEQVERRHIERVLSAAGGHVASAAARLGIPKSTLYQKLKRYGIRG